MTVLVVDHGHSTRCGIRDLGVRMAERLGAWHVDCNSMDDYLTWMLVRLPDVIIVNYRADLMPWWHRTGTPTFAVLHQYGPTTVDARAAELLARGFDHVLVLDPTVTPADPRVHAVGRPLPPEPTSHVERSHHVPVIGSFGFAFPHKGFADVAREIAAIDGPALYDLHMPEAHFNGANGAPLYTEGILADIGPVLGAPRTNYTADELTPQQLVDRLARNTVNCLLYAPGQPDAGLSSAFDYLIAAGRPMLVSSAEMFAAAQGCAAVWPRFRLADVLADLEYWEDCARHLLKVTAGQFKANVNAVLEAL